MTMTPGKKQFMSMFIFTLQTAVGPDHVIVVTTESQVYSWGDGSQGQLGHGDLDPREKPTLVNTLVGKSIIRYRGLCNKGICFTEQEPKFQPSCLCPCNCHKKKV